MLLRQRFNGIVSGRRKLCGANMNVRAGYAVRGVELLLPKFHKQGQIRG